MKIIKQLLFNEKHTLICFTIFIFLDSEYSCLFNNDMRAYIFQKNMKSMNNLFIATACVKVATFATIAQPLAV